MREFICGLIRESKQRVDWEESRHCCTVSTSDVRKEVACERMRRSSAAAANVAARASLGGIDILAKWKLKADQLARENRGGKEVNPKVASTVGRAMNGNVDAKKRGGVQAGSAAGKFGRNGEAMTVSKRKVASTRSICVKDVIGVLEKEPQMSKSTLMYLLMNPASRWVI